MRISDWSSDVCFSDLVAKQPGDPAGRAKAPMCIEAIAGGDQARYILEAASGTIEGQARGEGFARVDPEIAVHMLAVRPARAHRGDDRHPVREGEGIREAGIRHHASSEKRRVGKKWVSTVKNRG